MTLIQLKQRIKIHSGDPGYFFVTLTKRGKKSKWSVCGYHKEYQRIKKRIDPKKKHLGLTLWKAYDGIYFHLTRREWQERHPV